MSVTVRSSAATHPGPRAENQDACLGRPDLGLWAVADGAGGHAGGARAAAAVVAALQAIPAGLGATELLAEVRRRIAGVHASLRAEAAALGEGAVMASTVVALMLREAHFACLWAGDSRAWRLAGGRLQQLTHDHSRVQEMLDAGEIDPAAAGGHAEGNVITRAIGADGDAPDLDKVIGTAAPGDAFLLCSDGVWKALDDAALAALLAAGEAAEQVVAAALARGATDNVTAVVATIR